MPNIVFTDELNVQTCRIRRKMKPQGPTHRTVSFVFPFSRAESCLNLSSLFTRGLGKLDRVCFPFIDIKIVKTYYLDNFKREVDDGVVPSLSNAANFK